MVVFRRHAPWSCAGAALRLPLEEPGRVDVTAVPDAWAKERAQRVLIIEDNQDATESLKEVLELNEHVVDMASTGPQGLAKARTFKPDLILCDIGLPGMDGFEVARAVRADSLLRETHLVALSGYATFTRLLAGVDRRQGTTPSSQLSSPPMLSQLASPRAGRSWTMTAA